MNSAEPLRGVGRDVPEFLRDEVADFLALLQRDQEDSRLFYQTIEARLEYLKSLVRGLQVRYRHEPSYLAHLREWFKQQTDTAFSKSRLMHRARTWPEGYPGDYLTLEAVYNEAAEGSGAAYALDRYFLSRPLAVAVRARLRMLSRLLAERAVVETGGARWLNLAAGSCRELLDLPAAAEPRKILCVDRDPNALAYARMLLENRSRDAIRHENGDPLHFANAKQNVERYGRFTTIYSAGLFDYLRSERLVPLIAGLYESLARGGVLIAPFKDAARYETFDCHWLVNWDAFVQRHEHDIRQLFLAAGVPPNYLTVTRDESGVILFFVALR
ncbi:MAG TPA: class I SAM-dependent methyltransferase [Sandaracinaceae bacterium]